jgi:formate dehydrogenase subunit gamma
MTTITSEAGRRRGRSGDRPAALPQAPAEVGAAVAAALTENAGRRGPLLLVLHAVQHALGHVPDSAVPLIALGLNLSRADVHGVLTFYTDLRRTPGGRVAVQVCRGEACQAVGAAELVTAAQQRFGVELGATTADGEVGLDEVFCLGNCALGPSALVAGRCLGRLRGADGAERLARAVAAVQP